MIVDISGLSGRGKGGRALSILGPRGLRFEGKEGRGVLRTAGADTGGWESGRSSLREGRSRRSIEEIESLAPCRLVNEGGIIISKTFSSSVCSGRGEKSSADFRSISAVSSSFIRGAKTDDFSGNRDEDGTEREPLDE